MWTQKRRNAAMQSRLRNMAMGWLMLIALLMVATAHSATITWTGAGSNNLFTNPNNWDLGRAPGSGDDVRIPNVGSHAEVVVDGGGFLNSLQSNLPLRVVGAYSLSTNTTFARDVVIEGGFVEMIPGTNVSFTTLTIQNGGTLRLNANCTATITGLFTFESGFLDGNGTTNANGGITLNAIGSGLKRIRDNHVLNVSGIATWTGGPLSIEGSGVFNLQGGATLNIQTDAEFAGGTFNNNGIVTKASGSSVTEFNTVFNNNNRVDVNSGTLFLSNGGTHTGQFNVATGRTLRFCGDHTFNASSTIQGAGRVEFSCGTSNINGTYAVTGSTRVSGATVNFNRQPNSTGAVTVSSGVLNFNTFAITFSGLTLSSGRLTSVANMTLNGTGTWSGGTLGGTGQFTINAGQTLNISGGVLESGRTINNNGTVNWSSGDVSLGGTFNNNSGATFNTSASGRFIGAGTFNNNSGALLVSTSGRFEVRFNNAGTCRIPSDGTLRLLNGGTHTGRFELQGTGTDLTSLFIEGNHNFNAGSVVTSNSSNINRVQFGNGVSNLSGSYSVGQTTITTGATVNFNTAATLNNLLLNGGGVLSGSATITVNNLTWTASAMAGSGTTNLAAATFNGGTHEIRDSRTVNLTGTVLWASGDFSLAPSARLNIQSTGLLRAELESSATMSGGLLTNAGTLRKSATTFTLQINSPFNNDNLVDVQENGLRLGGGGTHTGRFVVAANKSFRFTGGVHTLTSTARTEGVGMVDCEAGTVEVAGQFTHTGRTDILSGGRINFNAPQTLTGELLLQGIRGGSGVVTLNGLLRWQGGTFRGTGRTIATNSIVMSAGPVEIEDTHTLENRGTFTWNLTTSVDCTAGATFVNASSGVMNIQQDGIWNGGTLNNQGTINRTTSTGTASINAATFDNTGTVNVDTGTLRVNSNGTHTGSFNVSSSATLELAGGTQNFNSGARINLPANTTLRVSGGTHTLNSGAQVPAGASSAVVRCLGGVLALNAAGVYAFTGSTVIEGGEFSINAAVSAPGRFTLNTGSISGSGDFTVSTLTWTGGAMRGSGRTIVSGLLVNGSALKELQDARQLRLQGDARWQQGNFQLASGARFTILNSGELAIESAAQMTGGALENIGSLVKRAVSGTTTISSSLTNSGLLEVQVGTLRFSGSAVQARGTSRVASGATLQFANPFRLNGGVLEGNGTVAGTVENAEGQVSPGTSPGTLTISGQYTQGVSGTYRVEIGGAAAGQFDVLDITGATGTANLNGTLLVEFINGFMPAAGDRFRVMRYASRRGTFSQIVIPNLPPGIVLRPEYNPNDFTLWFGRARPGDVNGDDCVDDSDLLAVLFAFGCSSGCGTEDANGDGTVDDADLLEVLFNFGAGC